MTLKRRDNRGILHTAILNAGLVLVPAGVLLVLYRSTLVILITQWETKEEYGYCFLIPLVVGFLLWKQRKQLAAIVSSPSWHGAWLFLWGLFLFWLGNLGGHYSTLYISLWCVVVGLLWMALGWQKLKAMAFPLVFSLTMFPLPQFIHNAVTLKLQLLSSRLGVFLIQSFGMPAFREGNSIDLGFTQLQVVEACSGLHSAISLGVLGILMAYMYKAVIWKRGILVLSTIPLAIVMNSMRIALTGVIYKYWGAEFAEGFFHEFSGWLMFVLVLPLLYVEMIVLDRLVWNPANAAGEDPDHRASVIQIPSNLQDRTDQDQCEPRQSYRPAMVRLGLATLVLLLMVGLSNVKSQKNTPSARPFNQFPNRIGQWTGQPQTMDPVIIKELDLTDYVLMDYVGPDNRAVNFYMVYFDSQRKGESLHSPATCYPGHGWNFDQVRTISLAPAGTHSASARINSVLMDKGGEKQLMYFWFVLRGRTVTNNFYVKIYSLWDMVVLNRSDRALVRLVTTIGESEKLTDAEERLNQFAGKVVPILGEFIPN